MYKNKLLPFVLLFIIGNLAIAQEIPSLVPVVKTSWWQIANEDFDAGQYSNKPSPAEPTNRYHQQVSDFTIYKAANGKWQLVSAVRHTNFKGNHHFLMRWEADSITQTDWEEKGIFLTTDDFPAEAGYKPGVIYAPHCFQHNNKYFLFHNSSSSAHLLTSDDGINFNPFDKENSFYQIFDPGFTGRDLMVFDNRIRDGKWYVYYASKDTTNQDLKGRQFTDIYVRSANSLFGPWSRQKQAGMGTPNRPESNPDSKYNFVNAESPFVIYKDGFYYKFEQTNVVASKDPENFEGKPVVASILQDFNSNKDFWPVLAPEIIVDGEKMYIAYFMNHHIHPLKTLKQGGIFVNELSWIRK